MERRAHQVADSRPPTPARESLEFQYLSNRCRGEEPFGPQMSDAEENTGRRKNGKKVEFAMAQRDTRVRFSVVFVCQPDGGTFRRCSFGNAGTGAWREECKVLTTGSSTAVDAQVSYRYRVLPFSGVSSKPSSTAKTKKAFGCSFCVEAKAYDHGPCGLPCPCSCSTKWPTSPQPPEYPVVQANRVCVQLVRMDVPPMRETVRLAGPTTNASERWRGF